MLSIAASLCVYWYTWIRLDTAYDAPVRQWYVPLALFPEAVSEKELRRGMRVLSDPTLGGERDMRGCTRTGYYVSPWKPSRLLLWVFLRWPLECEYWHGRQTCPQDTCSGIRSDRIENRDGFDLEVRCHETGFIYGPEVVLDYRCRDFGGDWAVCSDEPRGSTVICLRPPIRWGKVDDVPCAEPWMVELRRQWEWEQYDSDWRP